MDKNIIKSTKYNYYYIVLSVHKRRVGVLRLFWCSRFIEDRDSGKIHRSPCPVSLMSLKSCWRMRDGYHSPKGRSTMFFMTRESRPEESTVCWVRSYWWYFPVVKRGDLNIRSFDHDDTTMRTTNDTKFFDGTKVVIQNRWK